MSGSFALQLRAPRESIRLVSEGRPSIAIRVEMPEVWAVVRFIVSPDERVIAVKQRALEALFPEADLHADFVIKLRGWEILDEGAPLSELGIVNGSILLLTHRRKRPVR